GRPAPDGTRAQATRHRGGAAMSATDDRLQESDLAAEARREMVAHQIAGRGVRDPRVLSAMERLPRERFVPPAQRDAAYQDRALPIEQGQTISQPYMVAYMTEALRPEAGLKVLEVGTGSGYQTGLLAMLAGTVHTIERLDELSRSARCVLEGLGISSVKFYVGDGSLGLPSEAPFDRILVTAGAPRIPPALIEQLVIGGRLVAPVGGPDQQVVVCLDRLVGRTVESPGLACRFVKLLGEQGWRADQEQAAPAD
ncbi:MAG: protein-L-isoaspartate(D-aspartate) O-methyltransferase, partial [Planctomycetota bacterium]